jgi:hypothetical protein
MAEYHLLHDFYAHADRQAGPTSVESKAVSLRLFLTGNVIQMTAADPQIWPSPFCAELFLVLAPEEYNLRGSSAMLINKPLGAYHSPSHPGHLIQVILQSKLQ